MKQIVINLSHFFFFFYRVLDFTNDDLFLKVHRRVLVILITIISRSKNEKNREYFFKLFTFNYRIKEERRRI